MFLFFGELGIEILSIPRMYLKINFKKILGFRLGIAQIR
jgi:hypothetical protein